MPEDKINKTGAADKSTESKSKKAETETTSKTAKKKKEDKFTARVKPELSPAEKVALDLRDNKNRKRPEFRRQEWFRYKRLGDHWRKPRGLHSKMRRHIKYRPNVVSIGYRGPKAARDKHPSGFEEVMVHNLNDLQGLDPKTQAIRIGHSVGYLKRMHIAIQADEMKLRILNFNRSTHDELLAEAKKRGIELPTKEGGK